MAELIIKNELTGRRIMPLNGVGGGPCAGNFRFDNRKLFAEANIPYSRLHDIEGNLGGGEYADIHNIFPIWELDENDPRSYTFAYTDEYIKAIVEAGGEPFYRLGETIDHGYFKGWVRPPRDMEKWARICANIVRHYNEGWADGFHYGIKYWEIWNEPENPPMWTGTKEEYFQLYRITANLLKREFPDIKVGGYASCGFYAVFDPNATDFYKSFVSYFDDFLEYISADETRAPLDFYSWHIYHSDVSMVLKHAKYVRSTLDAAGYSDTESILNEWNWSGPDMFSVMRSIKGAAFTESVMLGLCDPKYGVSLACYYDAQPQQAYGGLFLRNTSTPTPAYYAIKAFGRMRLLKNEAVCEADGMDGLYFAASRNDEKAAAVISNYGGKTSYPELKFEGAKRITVYLLDSANNLAPICSFPGSSVTVEMKTDSVILAEAEL
ncbi:MAG: GH39 family glycosyl hydrolase [Eubacteriales bacterium]|jgi:xylan 1,4-beta-xylosidase